ncbi:TerC family protein [Paenibacillus sp. IB182496]|uniref:TerC family protein n=2 Tax=Paenibacillus sabuli TaxID=2772509 RepID=A0A927GR07_9BACL|nr:TerC family protein [Paenibacillus sabuli]
MESLLIFLQIVFINVLLSGDNALVIAMASQHLPPRQRQKAIVWGSAAAVILRCALTLAAITLLQVPYLQAVGALLLLWIAVQLLRDAQQGAGPHIRRAGSLQAAIRTIVAADLVMSLDNVLAIAAVAKGAPVLMLLGIGLSIPMIVWGSQLLGALLRRYPILVFAGAGMLGHAAGSMLVNDSAAVRALHLTPVAAEALPVLAVPLVIVLALLPRFRRRQLS